MYNGEVSVHSLLCDQIIECWECSCHDIKYLNSSQSVLYMYIARYMCMLSYLPPLAHFKVISIDIAEKVVYNLFDLKALLMVLHIKYNTIEMHKPNVEIPI